MPHHRQAALGARRRSAPRPRGQRARSTDRRQRRHRCIRAIPDGENRAGHHQAQIRHRSGPNRHHVDRRDDPDRSRPTRADHRRPRHRQDDHRRRYDHFPSPTKQGRRARQAAEPQAALLHLCGDRPKALERGPHPKDARRFRRDGIHHHRFRLRFGCRRDAVPRPLRRLRHRRVPHGPRQGLPHRVRRPLKARGCLPPSLAHSPPPLRPRSLSGRCVLPPLPLA